MSSALIGLLLVLWSTSSASASPLLLSLWVNGVNTRVIAQVWQSRDGFRVKAERLRKAGLRTPRSLIDKSGWLHMAELSQVHTHYDVLQQRLMIKAPTALLVKQVRNFGKGDSPIDRSASGLTLNYDAVYTAGDGYGPGAWAGSLDATLFTPEGRLSSTGYYTMRDGVAHAVRLDTAFTFDRPTDLQTWVLGDGVSGSLSWSRSVHMAGLHVSRDYGLSPGLRYFLLPAYEGSTVVPAGIDVYLGASRVAQSTVASGPFELNNLPVLTGAGTATVVVRNVLGQQIVTQIPFYTSPQLLGPGRADYALDVGFLRRNYGVRSFDYGPPAASAVYRYGLADGITLEGHGELSRAVGVLGGGAAIPIEPVGMVELAGAISSGSSGRGGLYSAAFSAQIKPVNLFASLTSTTPRYADIGTPYAGPPPRLTAQVGGSTGLGATGTLAMSCVEAENAGYRTYLSTLSYARTFSQSETFGATVLYDADARRWSGQLFLSIPFGRQTTLASSVGRQNGMDVVQTVLSSPANPDGGFGYRLSHSTGGIRISEASGTWVGSHATASLGVSSIDGTAAVRAAVSGALVEIDGGLYAARQTGPAFALVNTGRPGIPVYLENRLRAVSNAEGLALITDLTPYTANYLSIDPRSFPLGTLVPDTYANAVPARNSGVLVDLAPRLGYPLTIVVKLPNGGEPHPGAPVTIQGQLEKLPVGYDGLIFLPDAPASVRGYVMTAHGACHFHIRRPAATSNRIARAGPIRCKVTAHAP